MTTTKIAEKVYMIDTLALGQVGTVAAYILKGRKTALVDTGYASSRDVVLRGLAEAGVPPSEVDYIIPTHVHLDHGGGAGHLLREMPRASVLAQEKGVPHLVDPTRLIESATRLFGEAAIETFGRPLGIDEKRITPVAEEVHVELGGLSITAVHAPGHAPHQLSVLVEEERLLLTADAVGIVYPSVRTMIPTTPPPSLDPAELWRTTEKLEQMGPRALLVPHYGVRRDASTVLEATRKKTDAWVRRVRQMKASNMGLDQIVDSLKLEVLAEVGLAPEAFPAYAELSIRVSVKGILRYLEKNP